MPSNKQEIEDTWPGTPGEDLAAEFAAAPYGAWFAPDDFKSTGIELLRPEEFTARSTKNIGYIQHKPCGGILKVIIYASAKTVVNALNAHLNVCPAAHPPDVSTTSSSHT